jgi:hypothetical protein
MSGERVHGRSPWREAFEAVVSKPRSEPESSVTISRNAKGAFQFEVTARGGSVTECNLLAQYEADLLVAKYPYPLEGSVSPPAAFVAEIRVDDTTKLGGRSRARRKPEAA